MTGISAIDAHGPYFDIEFISSNPKPSAANPTESIDNPAKNSPIRFKILIIRHSYYSLLIQSAYVGMLDFDKSFRWLVDKYSLLVAQLPAYFLLADIQIGRTTHCYITIGMENYTALLFTLRYSNGVNC